jgi:uncharacterized protein
MTVTLVLFCLLLVLVLALHIFSLPANWIILGLLALWKWTHPELDMAWTFFIYIGLMAAAGEALEFGGQILGAKRYGSTRKGNIGGIIGAIAGAILGAAFLLGLGALPGALLGAFAGCYILEMGQGRSKQESWRAAVGAFWGKFFGMAVKFSMGVAILALTIPHIWP